MLTLAARSARARRFTINALLIALAAAAVSLAATPARAHCPDTPPTVLSSYAVLDAEGAPVTVGGTALETPAVDSGQLYCSSERNAPRTIPPGVNTLRVRSAGDVAPTSGTLLVGTQEYHLSFTRVAAPTGAVTYDSAPVYLAAPDTSTTAGAVKATVCIGEACKSVTFATAH